MRMMKKKLLENRLHQKREVVSSTRSGVLRDEIAFCLKCFFEDTPDVLKEKRDRSAVFVLF